LEYVDDPDFDSQIWKTKFTFSQMQTLVFDFLNLNDKKVVLEKGVINKNHKLMVN